MSDLTRDEIAKMIDYSSALNPDATREDVIRMCNDAIENRFNAVSVVPAYVALAAQQLEGTNVKVLAAVGFPWGANTTKTKVFETRQAIRDGAEEVDMVINIGWLKSGDLGEVKDDIEAVVKAASEERNGIVVKVIIETGFLTDREKVMASQLAGDAGADFVKTCTGSGPGHATIHDIKLVYNTVGKDIGVKASGSVRYLADLVALYKAGANRFGSRSQALIDALKMMIE